MTVKKVIAYFMHEKEEGLCSALLTNYKKTDSYYIGEADDRQFTELQNNGIIIQVIEDAILPQTGQSVPRKMERKGAFKNIHKIEPFNFQVERLNIGFPAFYLFTIEGTLLEEYRVQLNNYKFDILEFLPPSSYLVRVDSEDHFYQLQSLLFVKDIRYYSSADTGVNVLDAITSPVDSIREEKKMLTFDVLLHRPEDLKETLHWLELNNVSIAGSAGRKIRIYLLENSAHLGDIASLPAVQSLDEYIKPHFHNDLARQIIGIDTLTTNIAAGITYTGEGQIVGIADTGIDDTHPDFTNQIHHTPSAWARVNDYSDTDGHGTHVAGSVVGNGTASDGKIKGTAPGAKIFFQSILNDKAELSLPLQLETLFQEAYDNGARIHNNSWGAATNSRYTVNSIEVDDFVAKHRDMLLIFSAGNDGNAVKPVNAPDGYPDFLSIGSPASAKNILTVGASRNTRTSGGYAAYTYHTIWPDHFPVSPLSQQNISGDSNALACFSSRGPCDDNRIKPDLVAPGTDIVSAKSSKASLSNFWGIYPGNPQYAIMGGTSMAAPIVAGCAAVVREFYLKTYQQEPSAAVLKAVLINGCRKLSGQDCVIKYPELPNYNQGHGMLDMTKTIPSPANQFFFHATDIYVDNTKYFKATGQRLRIEIELKAPTWLRICLAYTDIPGRALQNNLNLMLDHSATSRKWLGNENVPTVLKMPDPTNNIESIVISNAAAGIYTMQIMATNLIKGPQDFAFVITSGDLSTILTLK